MHALLLMMFLVPPRDMVTLEMVAGAKYGCGALKLDFVRVPPDGTSSGDEVFRVPEGKHLVITDIDWYYNGAPTQSIVLRVIVENLLDPTKRRKVMESIALIESSGTGGKNEHLTTGFVVSSKARLCVDVTPGPLAAPLRLSNVLMRGYLSGD